MPNDTIREAVGVFHDEETLRAAADDLMLNNFDRSALSILAGHDAVARGLGHDYARVADLEDDPQTARRAYMGTDSRTIAKGVIPGVLAYVGAMVAVGVIVASGGGMAAALVAVTAGVLAGGLIGLGINRLIDRRHADYLRAHLDRGGILLWVNTEDADHEARAVEILKRHSAEDVHIHALPKAAPAADAHGVSHELSFMQRLGM